MLRFLLAVCLLAAVGLLGFWLGRSGDSRTTVTRPAFTPPPERTDGTLPSGPEPAMSVPPSVDTGKDGTTAVPAPSTLFTLGERYLALPVAKVRPADVQDTFNEKRGKSIHEAMDILAPRGTPVLATDDGTIRKLFQSQSGGITIYQFDPGEQYCYYYAHLDRYAKDLQEGAAVHRGDTLGYVGTTGNAERKAPHLHFAILELGPTKEYFRGTTPINPYPLFLPILGLSGGR